MHWLIELFWGHSVAHAIFVLSLVAILGLALGSLKIGGIGLGIAGVLFAGLFFGHWRITIEPEIMHFAQEFGLILFVYTIGMQVGPGFFASLRQQGLPLNLLAAGVVILGALVAVLLAVVGGVPVPAVVGLFSGATTNTPSLGAAQQALAGINGVTPEMLQMPGLGYAVAYPFGILGIILTMLLVRYLLRIHPPEEMRAYEEQRRRQLPQIATMNIVVRNPNLVGKHLREIPNFSHSGVVVSRIKKGETISLAKPEDKLELGDVLLAVGDAEKLEDFRVIVGQIADVNLKADNRHLAVARIIVTHKQVVGKSVSELRLEEMYDVKVTRVSRAEIELTPDDDLRLQIGDTVTVVGSGESLKTVAKMLGNSLKDLNHPEIIPLFVGLALGLVVGSIPLALPGVPAAVKLGLAGGPLIVAILLSRLGKLGPLLWYIPTNANFLLREVGIVLFLACVGLRSGDQFLHTLLHGQGLYWMACGALITLVPLLVAAFVGRLLLKINYLSLCGVLAGSMTDPPALAFANSLAASDAPSISYATVYPLTMLLRVFCAQLMVLLLL